MRQIYIVNATQVVASESHPEGVYSVLNGYPVNYDSRTYEATEQNPNGSEELALICAQADFADRVKQLSLAHNREMWTVTLDRADGRRIASKSFGSFPNVTPEPEPEPEEEPVEEPAE
jgi:hypothetical protein